MNKKIIALMMSMMLGISVCCLCGSQMTSRAQNSKAGVSTAKHVALSPLEIDPEPRF